MSFGSAGRKVTWSPFRLRQKWTTPQRNIQGGEIVIKKDESIPRNAWELARVAVAHLDEDGYVRKVKVAVADRP